MNNNNNDTAPTPSTPTLRQKVIAAAYDPEECESCDLAETTCWECAMDALALAGILTH